ncbi:MAG TPA: sigma 54-interacting transcriptional regulator [Labilithrix sp.]|nr:sigma 54-interacting transcriptional regulator [Labilithrix sp.]
MPTNISTPGSVPHGAITALPGRATLLVTSGPDAGRSVRIDRPTLVGTDPSADLRLSDGVVSREHLRLFPRGDGIHVQNLDRSIGTWVGSVRVKDVVVGHTTSLVVGGTTLSLQFEKSAASHPLGEPARFGGAIGESKGMRKLFALLEQASRSDINVLVQGESGVGKDVLVNAIHARSERARGPFVTLDCGAISPTLIESELFGYARGAFTGAESDRDGAFAQADGGTLFLDEIGELPIDLQPKLLRVLETREVCPVGGRKSRQVDVRIIAATNRNLSEAVSANEFRRDLFYRVAVLQVEVPPLRERKEDILVLARSFLQRIRGDENAAIPPELEAILLAHPWPGNVRELRNVVQRYVVSGDSTSLLGELCARPKTMPEDELWQLPYQEARALAIERFERAYLPSVLARVGNVVVRAAEHAGVCRTSFHRMLSRIRPDIGQG